MYNKTVSYETVSERNVNSRREVLMKENYKEILEKCKLFEGMDEKLLASIAEKCRSIECSKNHTLDVMCGLYVISKGEMKVYHIEDEKKVHLNTLGVSEVFGYATLYSKDNDRYTEMTGGKSSELIFINAETVEEIILKDARIALRIISELTGKIRFLNKKIDSFVSGDLKKRLLKYIMSLPRDDSGRVQLKEGMSSLARRLGVGRASLYRLMNELSREGVIEKDGNEIIVK